LSAAAPVVVTQSVKSPKPVVAVFRPIPAGIVHGTTTEGLVTQSQLQAAIEQATNALRQLIYADAGTIGKGSLSPTRLTNSVAPPLPTSS